MGIGNICLVTCWLTRFNHSYCESSTHRVMGMLLLPPHPLQLITHRRKMTTWQVCHLSFFFPFLFFSFSLFLFFCFLFFSFSLFPFSLFLFSISIRIRYPHIGLQGWMASITHNKPQKPCEVSAAIPPPSSMQTDIKTPMRSLDGPQTNKDTRGHPPPLQSLLPPSSTHDPSGSNPGEIHAIRRLGTQLPFTRKETARGFDSRSGPTLHQRFLGHLSSAMPSDRSSLGSGNYFLSFFVSRLLLIYLFFMIDKNQDIANMSNLCSL